MMKVWSYYYDGSIGSITEPLTIVGGYPIEDLRLALEVQPLSIHMSLSLNNNWGGLLIDWLSFMRH